MFPTLYAVFYARHSSVKSASLVGKLCGSVLRSVGRARMAGVCLSGGMPKMVAVGVVCLAAWRLDSSVWRQTLELTR